MKKVIIIDDKGNTSNGFVAENNESTQEQLVKDSKTNIKEHLYMGYLIIGTIAFTLGILISIKRLNGQG
ncbi:MAG: hypothetical protein NT116_02325 [Candidatus Parcubacteria bacterium]|nr:hypothetical protein [Candidatus Parcubacteria bacterium]